MSIHKVNIHDIHVKENRQRKEFKPERIVELANSIDSIGLIQPIVIREEEGKIFLVAGERRLKAMVYVWNFGKPIRFGTEAFPEGLVPCIYQGEMSPIEAFEMELEENIRREDLTWQEKATATAQLLELRGLQAKKRGEAPPTIADIAQEIRGDSGGAYQDTREEILVAKNLDDPDVQKAKSASEAFKILKRKEEMKKSAKLAETVGRTFTASVHQLLKGDCLELMNDIPDGSVDVVLTDPPYGIDADQFGDSGGKTVGAHFYKDDFETWTNLMKVTATQLYRVTKPDAHAYIFGDIDNFVYLKAYMSASGWKCFRTPIIWVNPTAMRVPWIEMGPQRKYQICLYAVKGSRPVNRIYPDVVSYPSDENLNHPAQKPVDLYEDLLRRSILPGDTVLDPFAGSGPIFPAAHRLKCKAIGIEQDPVAYGICMKRLEDLK